MMENSIAEARKELRDAKDAKDRPEPKRGTGFIDKMFG